MSKTFVIENEHQRQRAMQKLCEQDLPLTITMTPGKVRSIRQNKLQRLWMKEIAEHFGDRTPEEIRGYCKLTIGVPILRAENDAFQVKYDRIVRPLDYEQKLDLMMEPLDMPVTRFMTIKQKGGYLDQVYRHFASQGVRLTLPPDDMFGETREACAA